MLDEREIQHIEAMQRAWKRGGMRIFTAPFLNMWGLGMYHLVNGLWPKSIVLESELDAQQLIERFFEDAVTCKGDHVPPVLAEVLRQDGPTVRFYRREGGN